ncbi:hypothetical protein LEP1GSC193_1261 [Leptospira alstonii serovar Pingchang str. 80-412]|uniref:Uncharacterized protein n=2 Tax=Leptospira alstonii TaxID=28452 RepID=M6CFU9_9LEPT|nr:hypothetical protein LEP1GSC194_0045 [Leptospira alstonii serovar Sichuan str. 79601]EQA78585.1 hypothetical protein LEP1GSC193_1261 [Leptospira alstonii serovar Pingchang str. 80-412]
MSSYSLNITCKFSNLRTEKILIKNVHLNDFQSLISCFS